MSAPVIILQNKPQISRYALVMLVAGALLALGGLLFSFAACYVLAAVLGVFGLLFINYKEYLYVEVDTEKKQITLVTYQGFKTETQTFVLNNAKIRFWPRQGTRGKVLWILDIQNENVHEKLRLAHNVMAGMDLSYLEKIYALVKPLGTDISPKDKIPRLF